MVSRLFSNKSSSSMSVFRSSSSTRLLRTHCNASVPIMVASYQALARRRISSNSDSTSSNDSGRSRRRTADAGGGGQEEAGETEKGRSCTNSSVGHLDVELDSPGSGRFVAFGNGQIPHQNVSIIMTCDVSDRLLALQEHWRAKNPTAPQLASPVKKARRNQRRYSFVSPMGIEDEEARIPAPVSFTIFLENQMKKLDGGGGDDYGESSSLGSSMCLVASCVGGSLSLDSVSFINSVRESLDRSVAAVISRRDTYQGPLLHQGALTESALNTTFSPSPVALPRQVREFSLRPNYSPRHAPASRYGHLPVHTLRPSVYDALFEWCAALGIDDAFARDVNRVALETLDSELRLWKGLVGEIVARRKMAK